MVTKNLDKLWVAAGQRQIEKEYWMTKLSGDWTKSSFPILYHRESPSDSSNKKQVRFSYPEDLSTGLIQLSNRSDVRLYMILLTALSILLKKYCGSSDIIIGSPIFKPDTDADFINTILVTRNQVKEKMTVKELLLNVKQAVIEADEYRDYPYEVLINQLNLPAPNGDFPLFDTAMLVENIHLKSYMNAIPARTLFIFERKDLSIQCTIEYNSLLYNPGIIEQIGNHFQAVIRAMISGIETPISGIDIMSPEEKTRLLIDFNSRENESIDSRTLDTIFEEIVDRFPHHIALTGYFDSPSHLSYCELNRRSNNVAHLLRSKGVGPDRIVGIMMGRSFEMMIGIWGILKAGGAYMPIDPDYPQDRIDFMMADSGTKFVLTASSVPIKAKGEIPRKGIEIIDISPLIVSPLKAFLSNPDREHSSADLAYIIYTSGSTGKPKGTLTIHHNVVRVVKHTSYIDIQANDRLLQLSNYAFDGSVFDIFGSFLNGATLVMLDSRRSVTIDRLASTIRNKAVTLFFVTTALFNNLVERSLESLVHVRKILFGGERCSVDYARKAFSFLGKDRICNVYGPTETTVYATCYSIDDIDPGAETLPIGKPITETSVYIVDKNFRLVPTGVYGEIYIGGGGLARGYLNNPELTVGSFATLRGDLLQCRYIGTTPASLVDPDNINNPPIKTNPPNKSFWSHLFTKRWAAGGILYRTGDLGRWLPDGNIEFYGRVDQQIKIRGFRIEPGEIEHRLVCHADITDAAVIPREDENGERYLCAYIVSLEPVDASELREYLADDLPSYMIPSFFIRMDKMPLTSNGKVNRKALPAPDTIDKTRKYSPPTNAIEEQLADIWGEILSKNKSNRPIGIDDNFFELGGHSLKAMLLISKIHQAFDVDVPLPEIFEGRTIRQLAYLISESKKDSFGTISPAESKAFYPLSPAQKRMFILQQMDPCQKAYNIPVVLLLEGALERLKIEAASWKMIERHESLRTSFHMVNENPVQVVHDAKQLSFEVTWDEILPGEEKPYIDDFIRPFDLFAAPLFRMGVIKVPGNSPTSSPGILPKHLFIVDMHHIISDGTSLDIFVKDFTAFYSENMLPTCRVQYKDYSQWLHGEIEKPGWGEMQSSWLKEFKDEIPVLDLPTDYPRPLIQDFKGGSVEFFIDNDRIDLFNRVLLTRGATLYMGLLAVLNILMAKLSGMEDVVIGTSTAGRRHADLQSAIGMFVNTLPLRNAPSGYKTFDSFLEEIKTRTINAFENQEYPFEDLVDLLQVPRDAGRNPLFDVLFILQNLDISQLELPGITVYPFSYTNKISKFDMTWFGIESESGLSIIVEYAVQLFKVETIERFALFFKRIMDEIIEDPSKKISDIRIIAEEDRALILEEFNNTFTAYPADRSIHHLFEEQAGRSPDAVASALGSTHISYRRLNEVSDALAGILFPKGVAPGFIVGVQLERSIEMVIGILAVLKAGGAYMPIDPTYPADRIDFMLKDSRAKILITTDILKEKINRRAFEGEFVLLDEKGRYLNFLDLYDSKRPGLSPAYRQPSDSLAYVIYTSGSTGRPKGVLVEHRNVVRLVKNTNYVDFTAVHHLLQTGALEFDASTFETWGSLLNGLVLYLSRKDEIMKAHVLKRMIRIYTIDIMWLTSPLFNYLSGADIEIFEGLKVLLVGGDILSPKHINAVKRRFPGLKIVNGYGPTENTTFSTTFLIDSEYNDRIPIGKAIANSTAFIVDSMNELVPVGVVGELFVGGDGVARGYLNNPELTRDSFVKPPLDPAKLLIEKRTPYTSNQSTGSFWSHLFTKRWAAGGSLYRTGDLARWLPDGNIDFIGRFDQQVKIRGFRIEPGEIENRLACHAGITDAVVIPREDENGERFLCAYIVAPEPVDLSELRDYLEDELPSYMIPTFITRMDKIPLTPNGKVDRKELPTPDTIDKTRKNSPPTNAIEEQLADTWGEILSKNKSTQPIGIDDNFFELGGHSLKAMQLISKMHRAFDVDVPLQEIFARKTIRQLAQLVAKSKKDAFGALIPTEQKAFYPLSPAQKRLFILQQIDPGQKNYNIPVVLLLEGEVDRFKIEAAVEKMIERHESLRTSFHLVNGEPVQVIHDAKQLSFDIAWDEILPGQEESCIDRFIRPFDLSIAPLFRIALIKILGNPPASGCDIQTKHLFIVDMHHIISDGTSLDIFVKDFSAFYNGNALPSCTVQYKDYSQWLHGKIGKHGWEEMQAFWLNEFSGDIPVLNCPTDYPRPLIQDFKGGSVEFFIENNRLEPFKQLTMSRGVTLYMGLLAVLNILMSKLSSMDQVVIGTSTAGRRHADIQSVIGMFVNTLPLKNAPAGEKTFDSFLEEIKTRTINAFEHQEYPFEDLVDLLQVPRDAGRNPLFDVLFILQNLDISKLELPGITASNFHYSNKIAKFDMTWAGTELENGLYIEVEYASKLFKKETVERFTRYFKQVITETTHNPGIRLGDIVILSEEEKHWILHELNRLQDNYSHNETLTAMMEVQCRETPGCIALVGTALKPGFFGDSSIQHMSYGKLDEISDRLAFTLQEKGIRPGSIVGIMVERSILRIVGILAILKAGAAYLPLNPQNPPERTRYMFLDSCASLLLMTKTVMKNENMDMYFGGEVLYLEADENYPDVEAPSLFTPAPSNFAYIIYTSGSTGNPKGVPITHANLTPLLRWGHEFIKLGKDDRVIHNLSYFFDWSAWEIFITLTSGASLYAPCDEGQFDPENMIEYFKINRISSLHITPSQLVSLLGSDDNRMRLNTLKYLNIGAEKLNWDLVERSFENVKPGCRVFNMYGPTEATIMSSLLEIERDSRDKYPALSGVPIGYPLADARLLVVDKYLNLCPVGVSGELVIGGNGLAEGYLNNPGLTGERFLAHELHELNELEQKGDSQEKSQYQRSQATPTKSFYGVQGRFLKKEPLGTLYKTGDLVRRLPDGNIEFLGRFDHQVKIRGYRIELGEIEYALRSHPSVKEALVTARSDKGKFQYLCAYLVTHESKEADSTILKEFLSRHIPGYMVPHYFIAVESFPKNPNGKVDLKALPDPDFNRISDASYLAPRSEKEQIIADIWRDILGVTQIGVDDNFFEIGGNSLNIVQLGERLRLAFGKNISTVHLFRYPKISSFIDYLTQEEPAKTEEAVLERIETTSKNKNNMKRLMEKRRMRRS